MAAVPSKGRASGIQPRPVAPEAELTRALYERHAHRIFAYCLHQLGSREEAEDATQTTFMNAFRGLRRGVVPELESAWLFKIARNVILTRRRSSSRRRRVETPGDLDAIQDMLPSPERNADELIRLGGALSAMPDQQRRALLLREWQGLSYREIGEELGLSQAAVETLLFRARRSLAKGLTGPEGGRRAAGLRGGLDLGSLLAGLKGLLGGGVAIKAVATAAVVAGSAVVAADPVLHHRAPPPLPAPVGAAHTRAKAPARVAPAVASAAPVTPDLAVPARFVPVRREQPVGPRAKHPAAAAAVERKRLRSGRQPHVGTKPMHDRGNRHVSVPAARSAPRAPALAVPRPAHGSAGHGHGSRRGKVRGHGNRPESVRPTAVAPPASVLPESGPPPETADGRSSHGNGHAKHG